MFASELKVLRNFFKGSLNINQNSVNLYTSLGYIPAPLTIYKNIYKVLPAEIIEIKNRKTLKKVLQFFKL